MIALGEFDGWSKKDVVDWIKNKMACQEIDRFEVLVADLTDISNYEESVSFLLKEKSTGELRELHDFHCSCGGFKWYEPERTSVEYLSDQTERNHVIWGQTNVKKLIEKLKKEEDDG